MTETMIKYTLSLLMILTATVARADDSLFSTNLQAKFQVKGCTTCHDFHEEDKGGLAFKSHAKRGDVNRCQKCHTTKVTGFEHPMDWFAMPGLYLSGMDAKETCQTIKKALHAEFKSDDLLAAQLEKHLFEDPRVLWGIEGATPNSGKLPFSKQEEDLVKGGLDQWRSEVTAWINGGMKCE